MCTQFVNISTFEHLRIRLIIQSQPAHVLAQVCYNMSCLGDGRRAICDLNYVDDTSHKTKFRLNQHVDDIKTFKRTITIDTYY